MPKLRLKDLSLKGKSVLMRVDFNVPLNKDLTIADDTRIRAAIPSILYILDHGGKVILISHLGRPKGKKDFVFSLKPCAERLSQLLQREVLFLPDCIGDEIKEKIKNHDIILLENLRFYEAEEHPEKDPSFTKQLSELGDIYVNDAFGTSHRKHSSTHTITKYFPNLAAMGLLLQKETEILSSLLKNPKRPFYAILGGAKVSTKIGVLDSLLNVVDGLFIGGGMSYTLLKAQGIKIGNSICEDNLISKVKEIMTKALERKIIFELPTDIVIANNFPSESSKQIIPGKEGIPDGWEGMDIGPSTAKTWSTSFQNAQTIFWNGPVGAFEYKGFSEGTKAIALALANCSANTIVGGGDTISAIHNFDLDKNFSHLSTGGGASLEFIEFQTLPGIEALSDKT